jgi:MoxR-like ATPase
VSVEGQKRKLSGLFFVVATQNPVEFRGTYPLPEAQMDRFAMQFRLGYLAPEQEMAVLSAQQHGHPIDHLKPCATVEDVRGLKSAVSEIRLSDELRRYIVDLVAATRSVPGVQLGASTRAAIALMKSAQAIALFDGEEFVSPEHIQELAVPVIAHRLAIDPQARFSGTTAQGIVQEILQTVPVPA